MALRFPGKTIVTLLDFPGKLHIMGSGGGEGQKNTLGSECVVTSLECQILYLDVGFTVRKAVSRENNI